MTVRDECTRRTCLTGVVVADLSDTLFCDCARSMERRPEVESSPLANAVSRLGIVRTPRFDDDGDLVEADGAADATRLDFGVRLRAAFTSSSICFLRSSTRPPRICLDGLFATA